MWNISLRAFHEIRKTIEEYEISLYTFIFEEEDNKELKKNDTKEKTRRVFFNLWVFDFIIPSHIQHNFYRVFLILKFKSRSGSFYAISELVRLAMFKWIA